jgi:capsular polysaccharide biosynthesis protein
MPYLIQPKGFKGSIDYCPPVNMQPEWEHLFRPDHAYKQVKLGAKLLHNVFLNHYGLVINNGLLVPGCAPNIGFSGYDDGFYWPHWKKTIEQMLVSRFGKSIESRNLDDDRTYLVIHSPWFSYYFWLTECLPSLLMVREYLHELVLIYPEQWDRFAFVQETLALFPELKVERVKRDVHLRVKNLVMPEVKPWTPMFIPDLIFQVRELLFNALDERGRNPAGATDAKSIYISRRSAARRKFTDEEAVEKTLSEYGFQAVRMEELDFFSQVQLMRDTWMLAGLTGAGHINIMFMQQQGGFLDLTNKEYITKSQYKFHYFKLCNLLEIKYGVSFFEHENAPDADHYSNQNLIADLPLIRSDLQTLRSNVG